MTDYTYSTGNPIGSTDVRDGVDNLKSLDVLLNSTDDTYQDRLGNTVPTAAGAIKRLGPVVAAWTFTTGGTLNYPNEAALNPVDGNYYGWAGSFPKVVAPGTNPTLPGSGYVPRTDVVLRDELTSYGASIADIARITSVVENMHSINAANYGVVNDQAIDQTSRLNAAISAAIAIGARYVQLNYDIKCIGEIARASSVVLVGNGSIDSSNPENYGICVGQGKHIIPNINSKSAVNSLDGVKRGIMRGTLNVVIVGDSVCTNDPNTITGRESLTYYLEQKLKSSLKGVTVNFYNRAIGGATFESFDAATLPLYLQAIATANAPWYTDFNKPWMSYVSSLNPDLVVVGFGMNGENTRGQGYTSIVSVLDKLNSISSKPSLAFITTPTPTANRYSNFGKYNNQSLRNHFAELVRSIVGRTNYVIDVNRAQQVACHGIDPVDYSKVETFNIQSGVTTESSAATVFNTNSRFFSAKFDLISSATPLQLQWGYNPYETSFNNSLIITNSSVTLYTNTTVLQTTAITTTIGEYNSFTVHVDRNHVSVLMNNVEVFNLTIDTIKNIFDAKVLFSGGPTKKNVRLFEFKPAVYQKTILSDEAWGVWTSDSSVGTKALIGGNSVNHPSSLGLSAFYKPAIDEFVNDLPSKSTRETIFNTPTSTGAASLITGKKFSDYSFCIFVFGNDSIGSPMCQVVPREVLVAGYTIQELQRNSSGTFAGLINVAITSDTGFTVSRSGTTLNQLGLIIGIA